MANRSDREQGQPNRCPRRYSLISRMGPCSRTPSGPAVSTDCVNRPDRRLHPTNAKTSIYLLQRGSHPQRTSAAGLASNRIAGLALPDDTASKHVIHNRSSHWAGTRLEDLEGMSSPPAASLIFVGSFPRGEPK